MKITKNGTYYIGKIRNMTNYEWLFKNWDKKVNDELICNTVGLVFAKMAVVV